MFAKLLPRDVRFRVAANVFWIFPALLYFSTTFENQYVALFLPIYQWALSIALPDYRIISITQSMLNGESVIAATVLAAREQIVGQHRLPPGFTITASTLTAHALKHVIIALLILLIWPRLTILQRIARIILCIPLLVVIEIIDIPMVLASAVNDLVVFNVAPELVANSWRINWTRVMDGGGRIVIPLASVFVLSLLHERLMNRMRSAN